MATLNTEEYIAGLTFMVDCLMELMANKGILTHDELVAWLSRQVAAAPPVSRPLVEFYADKWRTRFQ